jgi:hypothetical protein
MIRMHVRLIQHKFLETSFFYKRKKIRLFTVKIVSLIKGVFFTNSSFFQLFHHCRDIYLKISRYYMKISRSRQNPFFK